MNGASIILLSMVGLLLCWIIVLLWPCRAAKSKQVLSDEDDANAEFAGLYSELLSEANRQAAKLNEGRYESL